MAPNSLWQWMIRRVFRRHRDIKSFEHEAAAAGGVGGGHDLGTRIVPASKIVGSVGRWQNLRSDFFYRSGRVTQRFVRIGQAMRKGVELPPILVYKLRKPPDKGQEPVSEYYVVDGYHRVAMARKLGQDYLDAEVKEFKVAGAKLASATGPTTPLEPPADQPRFDDPSATPGSAQRG